MRQDYWVVATKGGYVFDRRVFLAVLLILCILYVAAAVENGVKWRALSQYCPEDRVTGCLNYYVVEAPGGRADGLLCMAADQRLCEPYVLAPGQRLGHVPGFYERNFVLYSILLVLAGFVVNHGMHNLRGRRR